MYRELSGGKIPQSSVSFRIFGSVRVSQSIIAARPSQSYLRLHYLKINFCISSQPSADRRCPSLKRRTIMLNKLILLLGLASFFSCQPAELPKAAIPEGTNMRVNAHTVTCTGEMEGTCLLVQEGDQIGGETWSYFYYHNSIEGFTYEPGFVYNLQVTKTHVASPAQDASTINYRLIHVLSRAKP